MLKRIMVAIAALSLVSCDTLSALDSIGKSPAPLAQTTVDDKALQTAWRSFDVSLDAVNLALDLKPSLIGTPGAKKLADAIDAVSLALTAAESAAAAGSTTDYGAAMAQAKGAFTEMRMAIQALKGK